VLPEPEASAVEYTDQKTIGVLDPQGFSIDHTWKNLSDVQFFSSGKISPIQAAGFPGRGYV
jgi:hypothetical protein